MDHYRTPFNVGFGVVSPDGGTTYSVQHTFDDVLNSSVTPTWFDHTSYATPLSGNTNANYAFPVRAIRLNVAVGTGTVTATIIQAGMPGL
jgi:hypothetical protein